MQECRHLCFEKSDCFIWHHHHWSVEIGTWVLELVWLLTQHEIPLYFPKELLRVPEWRAAGDESLLVLSLVLLFSLREQLTPHCSHSSFLSCSQGQRQSLCRQATILFWAHPLFFFPIFSLPEYQRQHWLPQQATSAHALRSAIQSTKGMRKMPLKVEFDFSTSEKKLWGKSELYCVFVPLFYELVFFKSFVCNIITFLSFVIEHKLFRQRRGDKCYLTKTPERIQIWRWPWGMGWV